MTNNLKKIKKFVQSLEHDNYENGQEALILTPEDGCWGGEPNSGTCNDSKNDYQCRNEASCNGSSNRKQCTNSVKCDSTNNSDSCFSGGNTSSCAQKNAIMSFPGLSF